MKNLRIPLFTILLTSILFACGGGEEKSLEDILASKNVQEIQAKRGELSQKVNAIEGEIKQLDEALDQLDTTKKLPLVTVLNLQTEEFNHYVELQGDVMTDQNVMLFPEFQGILKKISAKMGDKVNEGQLLATVDDGGLREQLASLEYQAELAKTTFERQERLWKKNIGSELEYLNAKTTYQASQKAVEQTQEQLKKVNVLAPFSGIIDEVIAEEGELVAPGQTPVMRIVNLSDMYVQADVPESYIATVSQGKSVNVIFPILDTTISSIVTKSGNYINPDNRTFKVEVDLPKTKLAIKPNLISKLQINDYTNPEAILIPQSLISENSDGDQYVYLVDNQGGKNIAKKQIISTGLQQEDLVEVVEGLSNNDQIIEEGARIVKDGQEVKIIK